MKRRQLWGLGAAIGLSAAAATHASPTPMQKCHAAKLVASGKYAACRLATEKRAVLTGDPPDSSKCDEKYGTAWTKADTKFGVICSGDETKVQVRVTGDATALTSELGGGMPTVLRRVPATGQATSYGAVDDGTLQAGAALNFADNGDGTITDHTTDLMWEKKVELDFVANAGNLHDADNCHPWNGTCAIGGATCTTDGDCGVNAPCEAGDCQAASPGGLTIFQWVAQLNAGNFAGHNDWRIPNVKELQSIIDFDVLSPPVSAAFSGANCGGLCTDITDASCSCTQANGYWSSTTMASSPTTAWYVLFNFGNTTLAGKNTNYNVRAVRGGL